MLVHWKNNFLWFEWYFYFSHFNYIDSKNREEHKKEEDKIKEVEIKEKDKKEDDKNEVGKELWCRRNILEKVNKEKKCLNLHN